MEIKLASGSVIGNVGVAAHWARRLLGLFHPDAKRKSGLLIYPCTSIHTFFMRRAIDVVFIGKSQRIIFVKSHVRPNRVVVCWRAYYALELPDGAAQLNCLKSGDKLALV